MVREVIFGTIGGLGLFLFGMGLMSDGLKNAAGERLRKILGSMTKKRVIGCLVGAGVTALIQSSSASTVMIVGFVNAGLLTLAQAIPVIIGTNIGTTATAWLVSISGIEAFKITSYALPAVAIGFVMQTFAKKQSLRNTGQILLGFGILFIGIGFMKDAFGGLEQSPQVQQLFIKVAHNPMLAVLAGILITMLIQSSSAAVASVQLLAVGGAFGTDWNVVLSIAIPFILGSNIGTTITAQLASIGTNINARRTAWAHTVFNIIGAFICFWFIPTINQLVNTIAPWELSSSTIAASIAIAHTSIKVIEAVLFLPATGLLEKVVLQLIKEKPGQRQIPPVVLEYRLLGTPEIALEQARHEIVRMAKYAREAVCLSISGLLNNNSGRLQQTRKTEDTTDVFQYEITAYLAALSQRQLSEHTSRELPVLLHTVNDLERIGDHAVNIAEIAERKIYQNFFFSESARSEVRALRKQVNEMFGRIKLALENGDIASAKASLLNENALNRMQIDFRRNHVQRMTDGLCNASAGLIFIDLVDNMEKIGDHLTNIAQAVIGGLQWDGAEVKPDIPIFQK
ncbi:MAG: Na/Pi cotransporter family protein [Sedimentisphaerales bacterium]|nr:Na/Pi cotransporter family protein [Sedimentisphaerales bacterium]